MKDTFTVALIKPDAVRRLLIGDILTRAMSAGLRVSTMRMLYPDVNFPAAGHWNPRKFYAKQHEGREYFERLVTFMCSGPIIAMILYSRSELVCAVDTWRETMGPFRERVPGTIRGDLMLPGALPTENLVHGSDSHETFKWEYQCLGDLL